MTGNADVHRQSGRETSKGSRRGRGVGWGHVGAPPIVEREVL